MERKKYGYTEVQDPSIIKELVLMPSTLENIDFSLYDYINDHLDVSCTTNEGWRKVPILWQAPERAVQVKGSKEYLNVIGRVKYPAISVQRMGMAKDLGRKGGVYGNAIDINKWDNKGGDVTIGRRINQEKTRNFQNADAKRYTFQNNFPRKNNKVVYETITIPLPVYVDIDYKITLLTEYQQQLNEMMAPFINIGKGINYFGLRRNGWTYEGFLQSGFDLNTNVSNMGEDYRNYSTTINIKVLGYLVGSEKNEQKPKIVYRENAVDIKIGRERVVLGTEPWNISPDKLKYRD